MRSVAAVVALVACLHAGAWAIWQTQAQAPNIEGVLNSVSYTPFHAPPDDPTNRPTEAQIRADLQAIANEFGLKVTLGIALDYTKKPWKLGVPAETRDEERKRNEERNEREITT